MYKFLFISLFIYGQVLAQKRKRKLLVHDIVEQLMAEDITEQTIIENLTEQSITQLISEVKPLDRTGQQSKIDLNWQSLLKDLYAEPIAQDMAIRRIYKDVAPQPEFKSITKQSTHQVVPSVLNVTDLIPTQEAASQPLVKNKTTQPEFKNITKQSMLKTVPSVLNVTEQLSTQEAASQPLVKNTTETLLGTNITQQPQDPNEPGPSQAQSVSMQQDTIQEHYQNATNSAGTFVPTSDHNYHSPYLDPYKDSNYKSSMPPIQTQEQWNATNWHEEGKLSDEEERQADEYRAQEKRYKKMQEEINNTTTTCEEFLNNTVFDVEKVLDKDWHTIYYWNVREEDPYNMRFSKPTETMIKRFKDGLNAEIKPPVDWSAAELFVETNVEYSALYVKTNVSGLYRAIPSAAFQYFGIPILNYALKMVNNESLGIVNCKARQCYALCDMEKLPQIEEIPKIAKSMGFYCLVNNSFVHVASHDERVPDDLDESMEDNFLGDYDTLNSDPLQIDIF